jgi:hypothetical protein
MPAVAERSLAQQPVTERYRAGPGRPGTRGGGLGRKLPAEVGLEERALEHLDRVGLPDQPLGLVRAVRRLDAPEVDPDAERLRGLDRGNHVLVAGHEDRVGDRAVPGQRLHVGADLGVHALLLAARVQVAQAQLHPRHLRDDPLVDGGHPVPRRVVPVDPQQLAAHHVVRVPGERLDQLVRVDLVLPARGRAEQQLAGGGVDVPDIDHDGVAGEQRQR